ncbi:aromatic prenyltransferase [Streptomyces collinus]|uniref:aromatic prenyltransferase n=1 Tax=Streptomyces collinus TaxID=42684 RepID=UPI0029429657|nr:aromatic prenyltransferase [Streptomyces collinus]
MNPGSLAPLNLDKLRTDLERYAQIVGTSYDAVFVDRLIKTLQDVWKQAWVGVRTTTHGPEERDVNLRVCYRESLHPVRLLRTAGLVSFTHHPLENLIDDVIERFSAFWGIDAPLSGTVDKVWMFFDGGVSLRQLRGLPHLPPSLHAAQEHFDRNGMDRVGLLGLDFTRHTVNVYAPIFPPGRLTPDRVTRMITDLGFVPPSGDEAKRGARAFSFYQTFGLESPDILRLCFPTRCTPEEVPTQYHPVLADFVEQAPFATQRRAFLFYLAYGPKTRYFKVSSDYRANHHQMFATVR